MNVCLLKLVHIFSFALVHYRVEALTTRNTYGVVKMKFGFFFFIFLFELNDGKVIQQGW
jgi:hypothetical protein